MPGKVYGFNTHGEPINNLTVNGRSAGSIAGFSQSGPTVYTPASRAVARARHGDGASSAVFPNDMPTSLRIDWDSFSVQTSIDLSRLSGVSLDDDLLLYIAANQLVLMTTRGFVLLTVATEPRGG